MKILCVFVSALLVFSFAGCGNNENDEQQNGGSYTLEAKYTKIRSYRDGGGIFLIRIIPDEDFSGEVFLSVSADSVLNAKLDKSVLDSGSTIAEVTIQPDQSAEIKSYEIELKATHSSDVQSITLGVDMYDWDSTSTDTAIVKRDEILEWLEKEHPEYGNLSKMQWFAYMTYPEILVVEHWTFLNPTWEMRMCFHVMIPPYDWSMLSIRSRDEWDFQFAAKRESDGTTYEIPVAEYPVMCGY
jgi:hypothetical protein